MEIGLALPQYKPLDDFAQVPRFAAHAERLGYDSLWVGDRLLTPTVPSDLYPGEPKPWPPQFASSGDPFVVWAAAAAATQTIRLGSSTLNATWYNGVQLARQLTSLDVLSSGRLVLGLGTSWMRDEYRASNVDWSTRGRRFDETIELLKTWWTANPVRFHGQFFDVPESVVDLRPVQPGGPPLLLAGVSAAAMRRIGRVGDGWLVIDGTPADYLAALWDEARAAADAADRDPLQLRRVIRVNSSADSSVAELAGRFEAAQKAGYDEAFADLTYVARSVDEAMDLAGELFTALRV